MRLLTIILHTVLGVHEVSMRVLHELLLVIENLEERGMLHAGAIYYLLDWSSECYTTDCIA